MTAGSGGGPSAAAGHFMIEALGDERVSSAYDSAYGFKAGRLIAPRGAPERPEGADNLEHVAEIFEMAAVDLWDQADGGAAHGRGRAGDGGGPALDALCRECFGLLEACEIPSRPGAKFSHVMRMFAYAYVGDRGEAMRRYVAEHAGELDMSAGGGAEEWAGNWEYEVMSGVHRAFLLLVGRRGTGELRRCISAVEELRRMQGGLEHPYLEGIGTGSRPAAAHRLAAMYHLAKSVELLAGFLLEGSPANIESRLGFHLDKSVRHSGVAGSAELDVLLRISRPAFKKMARGSVWTIARRAGGDLARFVESLTRSDRPVFELLYPQRRTVLDGGLLDPANSAMVINLPTSGGKTLLAEFKIIQAAGGGAVVAYAAPTRALVNQVAATLRRDLGPLGMRVEKMSGALEIDGFEDSMLGRPKPPDVIVTTPEKLLLLLRSPEYDLASSLSLCIIDEAHNLGDPERGINLEMLVSTVKRDCAGSGLLLLTPFIPNGDEVARWIDPENPKSVTVGIDWKPNDRMVGAYYAEGRGRKITTHFLPLATSADTIRIGRTLRVGTTTGFSRTASRVKGSMHALTSLVATQLDHSQGLLVLAGTIDRAWSTAGLIYENLDVPAGGEPGGLAGATRRFVASELGAEFPLAKYLERGIGVHHAGIPDEIRALMERLMESGQLRILVGTTTIAQGLNFPVSGILVSSYAYPYRTMPHRDFWNLLGRAGRIDQPSLGVVGIASDGADGERMRKTARYVQESTEALASRLTEMVEGVLSRGSGIDLAELSGEPGWSSFVQYIAHMKNQSGSLARFVAESESVLHETFGYERLGADGQRALLGAIREYGAALDKKPDAARLSDLTGFTPESVEAAGGAVGAMRMNDSEWSKAGLFGSASGRLEGLIRVMLDKIPEVKGMDVHLPGGGRSSRAIAGIAADWVGGRGIPEIAEAHFGGTGQESVTACVRSIYSRIIHSASWGLAGMQRIHGLGQGRGGGGGGRAARSARNLPAMVYHGVDTDEAVLMRMNSVPRSVAGTIGSAYAEQLGEGGDVYEAGGDVTGWLAELPDSMWRPKSGDLAGRDCKAVWQELAGVRG